MSLTRTLAPAPVPATRFNFRCIAAPLRLRVLGSGVVMGGFWGLARFTRSRRLMTQLVPCLSPPTSSVALGLYRLAWRPTVDRRYAGRTLCRQRFICLWLLMCHRDALLLGAFAGAFANRCAVSLAKLRQQETRIRELGCRCCTNALGSASRALVIGWAMRTLAMARCLVSWAW